MLVQAAAHHKSEWDNSHNNRAAFVVEVVVVPMLDRVEVWSVTVGPEGVVEVVAVPGVDLFLVAVLAILRFILVEIDVDFGCIPLDG